MCGIIGQINFRHPINPDLFVKMRDTLKHRGPDDKGLFLSRDKTIALGHRRLAFLDLSPAGRQPMCNAGETVWITCNGEIYNYRTLKQELETLGHHFSSSTDSEVIIHGYEQWGIDIIHKLKGMFAFALYDSGSRTLYIVRDRFGIKPLYWYRDTRSFIFASEIKGIIENPDVKRNIDYSSVCDYFTYRYVPSPKTIWKGIFKLPPAHYLALTPDGKITQNEYWKLPSGNIDIQEDEAVAMIEKLTATSVQNHIISDVPIGSFLSGGYDSSALVWHLNRLKHDTQTFAIGFKNWEKSEHYYAEIVAERFNTKHTSTILGPESLDVVNDLSTYYDEPIADISILPTYLISKTASKKVKAVVSGEGADELFCGYTWHNDWYDYQDRVSRFTALKNRLGFLKKPYAVEQYSKAMAMGHYHSGNLHHLLSDHLSQHIPDDSNWFYRHHYNKQLSPLKSFQTMDIKCFMGELVLTKIDRASMANSLEVRVPFLDHELFEYLFKLNESVYFKRNGKKHLLQESIKTVMPESILSRSKQGFVGPDSYYMDINWYRHHLKQGELIKNDIIQKKELKRLIDTEDHWRLWKILIFEFWFSRWA